MSVSKWAWTEKCDTHLCVGDCDYCEYANEETYALTPAAILWYTVKEWGLTDCWNEKIYNAAFNDMMGTLIRNRCVIRDNKEEGVWGETSSNEMYKCSECKCTIFIPSGIKYDYCPNCGAKMGGERREDNG